MFALVIADSGSMNRNRTIASFTMFTMFATGATIITAPAHAAEACTVKLSTYATPGQADSLPGVNQAMDAIAAAGGGTICVDAMYNVRNYINLDRIPRSADIRWVGTSTTSSGFTATANSPIFYQGDQTLRPEANGNTASPMRGQYRYNTVFSTMKLVKPAGTIGRIFDFRTGAQVNMRIESINADTSATGANNEFLFIDKNHQQHGSLYQNNRVQVRPVNTSGVVKILPTNNFYNNNQWNANTFYKFDQNGAPCFELRPVSGGVTNNAIRSLTGQNCAGGFIHIYGQNGGGIYDSSNWDLRLGTGFRDSVRLGKTAATSSVTSFTVSGMGIVEQKYGQAALMSGRWLLALGAGTSGISILGTSGAKSTGLVY